PFMKVTVEALMGISLDYGPERLLALLNEDRAELRNALPLRAEIGDRISTAILQHLQSIPTRPTGRQAATRRDFLSRLAKTIEEWRRDAPTGASPTEEAVAEQLGISVRWLQYQLKRHKLSWHRAIKMITK